MKHTGEQGEAAEADAMGGNRKHDSSSSSSQEEEDKDSENSAIRSDPHYRQPHMHNKNKIEVEQCAGSSRQNKPSTPAAKRSKLISSDKTANETEEHECAAAGIDSLTIASTSEELTSHDQFDSNQIKCESCANYNYRNHSHCHRSRSLPSASKQAVAGSNLVESSEINTIREFTSEQSNSVSGVLRFCKRRVLFPYLKLLGAMGLRPLYSDGNDSCMWTLVLSKMYLFLVGLVLIMGYTLQFMTCFRRDLGFSYNDGIRNPPTSLTNSHDRHIGGRVDGNVINATLHAELLQIESKVENNEEEKWLLENSICSGNVIYVYCIPSLLHLASFIYMVYLYWIYDDEHLQNLMERVFIQAAHANINYFSQRRLIRRLQGLVTVGCIWIICISGCQFLQVLFSKIYFNIWIEVEYKTTYAMSAVLLFSTLWQDAIQITVVISFAIHCNLICTYTELIKGRLLQHSISLPECMKELGELNKLLSYLNDDLALGLAPLLFIDGAYATGAIVELIRNGKHLSLPALCMLVASAILWAFIIVFPLFYAATVSTSCQTLKDMGHMIRIRPFGYQFVAQYDLDSFLLFASNLNLKARILKVPITTPILSIVAIALSFSVLLWGYFH